MKIICCVFFFFSHLHQMFTQVVDSRRLLGQPVHLDKAIEMVGKSFTINLSKCHYLIPPYTHCLNNYCYLHNNMFAIVVWLQQETLVRHLDCRSSPRPLSISSPSRRRIFHYFFFFLPKPLPYSPTQLWFTSRPTDLRKHYQSRAHVQNKTTIPFDPPSSPTCVHTR